MSKTNETGIRPEEAVLAIAVQAGVPVFIYSEPGSGKSATVRSLHEQLRTTLHTIMLSVREPTDQGGLPAVFEQDGEKLVRIVPPGWARDLIRNGGGSVFFDEVSAATPTVMNSALRIVQEGVVGDNERLPRNTSFVLAGNPPETNTGANELTAGIANRCLHLHWPFSYERWRRGMLCGWTSDGHVPRLPNGWESGIHEMNALVVAFLDTQPMLAQKQPDDPVAQGRAWPSGRTWDLTARMLAAAKAAGHGPRSVVGRLIVLGLVGEAAQTQFTEWVANMDLPSIDAVIDDPTTVKIPKRQDQVLTLLTGIVAHIAAHRGDLDKFMAAWSFLGRVAKADPSLVVRYARDLSSMEPPGADKIPSSPYLVGLKMLKGHLGAAGVDYGRS